MEAVGRYIDYSKKNIEFLFLIVIFIGLITFNKAFAYVGFRSIYITEVMSLLCILAFGYRLLNTYTLQKFLSNPLENTSLKRFWPLIVLFFVGLVKLAMDIGYGFQTLRHSMILFYTVLFAFVFFSTLRTEKQFTFLIIVVFIIIGSLFNGSKIIFFKLFDYSLNDYEKERVLHNETDVICASIALLGLAIYHKLFLSKSRLAFVLLVGLNIIVLILTVKRSAAIGLLPSFIIWCVFSLKKESLQRLFKVCLFALVIILVGVIFLPVFYEPAFSKLTSYIINKTSLQETNTTWRLIAWNIAWHKFMINPLWGIGYGEKIIDTPIRGVFTGDPHNSYLAFLTRHGIVFSLLYLFFIIQTYFLIVKELLRTAKNSQYYNHLLFILCGFVYMTIFAGFNVVLENQYEGIFYNFFLLGTYILLSIYQTEKPSVFVFNKSISYSLLILLGGFLVLSFSPLNESKMVYLFNGKTKSFLPVIHNDKMASAVINNNGLTILPKNTSYEYNDMVWLIPEEAKKMNYKHCSLIIEVEEPLTDFTYSLYFEEKLKTSLKAHYIKSKKQVQIPLNQIHNENLLWKKVHSVGIVFPQYALIKPLTIKNVYLKVTH